MKKAIYKELITQLGKWYELTCEGYLIEGHPWEGKYKFYARKNLDIGNNRYNAIKPYTITEGQTGFLVCRSRTLKGCINELENLYNEPGIDLDYVVDEALKKITKWRASEGITEKVNGEEIL